MSQYQIDVLVESDRERKQLEMFIAGVLALQSWHFQVKGLKVTGIG